MMASQCYPSLKKVGAEQSFHTMIQPFCPAETVFEMIMSSEKMNVDKGRLEDFRFVTGRGNYIADGCVGSKKVATNRILDRRLE